MARAGFYAIQNSEIRFAATVAGMRTASRSPIRASPICSPATFGAPPTAATSCTSAHETAPIDRRRHALRGDRDAGGGEDGSIAVELNDGSVEPLDRRVAAGRRRRRPLLPRQGRRASGRASCGLPSIRWLSTSRRRGRASSCFDRGESPIPSPRSERGAGAARRAGAAGDSPQHRQHRAPVRRDADAPPPGQAARLLARGSLSEAGRARLLAARRSAGARRLAGLRRGGAPGDAALLLGARLADLPRRPLRGRRPLYLVFGGETRGLPADLLESCRETTYRIPIFTPHVRSLNLANAVSVAVYEALRQRGAAVRRLTPACRARRSGARAATTAAIRIAAAAELDEVVAVLRQVFPRGEAERAGRRPIAVHAAQLVASVLAHRPRG